MIRGNIVTDTLTPYNFGLYTDYGAAWVTVEGNLVLRADNTSVLTTSPPLKNVVYRDNFWDADPIGAADPPSGVTYEGNTTITDEDELAAATTALRARAGLQAGSASGRGRAGGLACADGGPPSSQAPDRAVSGAAGQR